MLRQKISLCEDLGTFTACVLANFPRQMVCPMTPETHAVREIHTANFAQMFTCVLLVWSQAFLARVRAHVPLQFTVTFKAFETERTRKRSQLVASHVRAFVRNEFLLGVKYFVTRVTRMRLVRERKATPVLTQIAR